MADENSIAVGANQVRKIVGGNWQGVTGKNVIIGIIDSGIQYKSKGFQDKAGNSRLLYIYDQSLTRTGAVHADGATEPTATVNFVLNPPFDIGIGLEYEHDVITAAIRSGSDLKHEDTIGHGTSIAGIAASNGFQPDQCNTFYSGIAPEADIIMVKTGEKASEKNILDAICYLILKAKEKSKALVINISMASNLNGFHNGNSFLEQNIDHLLKNSPLDKGFTIVTIAGNFHGKSMHAKESVPVGGNISIHFTARKNFHRKFFQVWCEIKDKKPLTFKIVTPNGEDSTELTDPVSNHATSVGQGGSIQASSQIAAIGDQRFQVIEVLIVVPMLRFDAGYFIDKDATSTKPWFIELKNTENDVAIDFHAWADSDDLTFTDFVDDKATVTIPGTAKEVITVGGHYYGGGIASFSGTGTTVAGEIKPEITAPAKNVIALDNDLPGWCTRKCCCCCDIYHTTDTPGTSLAAPTVSGAIALMLDLNNNLTHSEIRRFLFKNINDDHTGGGLPNITWGYGKLNVKKLVEDVNSSLTTPRVLSMVAASDPVLAAEESMVEEVSFSRIKELREEFMESPGGKFYYSLATKYSDEVFGLIDNNKKVATIWHRNDGPLMLRLFGRLLLKTEKPMPSVVNGKTVKERLQSIAGILKRFASPSLGVDIEQQLPILLQMEGKSVHQIMDYLKSGTNWK